jgi:hypothetical protein
VFSVTTFAALLGNSGRSSDPGLTSWQAGDLLTRTHYSTYLRLKALVMTAGPRCIASARTARNTSLPLLGSNLPTELFPINGCCTVACLHSRLWVSMLQCPVFSFLSLYWTLSWAHTYRHTHKLRLFFRLACGGELEYLHPALRVVRGDKKRTQCPEV